MEDKDTNPKTDKKNQDFNESPNKKIPPLNTTIDSLSAELEEVKKDLQKRKNENITLKILFYTGLLVLLVGFLYSNSVLQRAHMRSLEKNIISLEQRLSGDIGQIKIKLEHNIQEGRELKLIEGANIFTVLERMDHTISKLKPKNEKIVVLLNQVRTNTNEFSQLLKNQQENSRLKVNH
jgi:hypothetical protein